MWALARVLHRSTPLRTFVVYPIALWALEAGLRRRLPPLDGRGVPLMVWGYLQYRWCGRYRRRRGGGGPGLEVPPERLVTTGPYAYTRNPMYLGHLIFLTGLAIALRSPRAALLAASVAIWFDRRVRADEARLQARFGAAYTAYARRVRRWLPGLLWAASSPADLGTRLAAGRRAGPCAPPLPASPAHGTAGDKPLPY